MKVRVYVEGGGHNRKTMDDRRRGFGQLFEKVVGDGDKPKVKACGGWADTFREFRNALRDGLDEFLVLLVDSEDPVKTGIDAWGHLSSRDNWPRPLNAQGDQAHLMVQCMESWLLSDHEALTNYYGQGFLANSLPARANVELIDKEDVFEALAHATRQCKGKGRYHKTRHGFQLLALVNPDRLRHSSDHARRLFEVLTARSMA